MSDTIGIGAVGYGYWGPNLVRNFMGIEGCSVKWICDSCASRLEQAKQRYPAVSTTSEFTKLIEDPEVGAVVISTPTAFHYRLAKASLQAGRHTFVEKPLAGTYREGQELVELAQDGGLTLMVGHTFVYSAAVRKVKEVVASGDIGDIVCIYAERLNLGLFQQDINVVWDLAPHDLSILLCLLEEAPSSVSCQGAAHYIRGIEDTACMTLQFPSGAFAIVHTSWLHPNKTRLINIVGTRKMIRYDDTEPLEKIRIYDKRFEPAPYYDGPGEFQYAYHYGDVEIPYFKQSEPLRVECEHFIDCVRTGNKPESSGCDGLTVLGILEAASESISRQGMQVPIEWVTTRTGNAVGAL